MSRDPVLADRRLVHASVEIWMVFLLTQKIAGAKPAGVWSSEGAEVEAIANVAESAHSAVATG